MKLNIDIKLKFFFALFLLLVLTPLNSLASIEYSAKLIPDSLITDATCVYRINNRKITFKNNSNYTITNEVVVTIMKEGGKNDGVLAIFYDSNSNVRFIEGEIFDSNGKSIKKLKNRDLSNESYVRGFLLYEDTRILYYAPNVYQYPYTVRYVYEKTYNRGLYYGEVFFPHMGFNRSVEFSSLVIEYPNSTKINLMEFNLEKVSKVEEQLSNKNRLEWQFTNQPAVRREFRTPSIMRVLPTIMFATEEFEFNQYKGSNSSWSDYGKWIWELNKGRDVLPESTISFLKNLIKDIDNERDQVKAIYQYMQSRTRYVNISLGIGGLQPFDAQTVDKNGYGDCKALSNYMMSMLKAVGIESHYTLVYGGRGGYDFYPEFVASQFNHAILCVPLKGDTVYLECTSQIDPFGYLGDFTDDRHVLIIKHDGGHLRKTPAVNIESNSINSKANVVIDDVGNGIAQVEMWFGGHYFNNTLYSIRQNEEEQKKWIYEEGFLSNCLINSFSIQNHENDNPKGVITLDATLRSYANISRGRMFVPINLLSAAKTTPPRIRNRAHPFELKYSSSFNDSITFVLPKGYALESEPQNVSLESEFGMYNTSIIVEGNTIIYIRNYSSKPGYFPPEKYPDYFEFWQNIVRADNQNVTFRKE
jgi:hypothetical protein